LGDLTEDGQVFRVDMRLRPNGDSGPLVGSLGSLENYFIAQGREWERYAWIKARVMNEGVNLQPEWVSALHDICRPFVFRKYLDYGAINAMRDLHAQIRREVARKDMAEHIKLGPGGIREIEFMAQVFQLIRGGREPVLQIRPTLQVLALLVERRLLPAESAHELTAAYDFLRRLEHRLQYVGDAQTHRLPTLTRSAGRSPGRWLMPTGRAFSPGLDAHRGPLAGTSSRSFPIPKRDVTRWPVSGTRPLVDDDPLERLSTSAFASRRRCSNACTLPSERPLPATAGEQPRAPRRPRTTPDRCRGGDHDPRRHLAARPRLPRHDQPPRRLSGAAAAIPAGADETRRTDRQLVLGGRLSDPPPDSARRTARLANFRRPHRLAQIQRDLQARLAVHVDDTEREMDLLREAHHAQVFHLLAQDIAGMHTVEHLADRLSELADIMVQTTLDLCWQKLRQRHPHPERPPQFAVIAYGKLGGKELGFASDLDLVYLHNDSAPGVGELYSRLGQRMSTWMSTQTAAGMLFEVDLRLRPNGDSGMLVCPVDAFRAYQLQHAWVWEHQALTRARFCAGDPAVGQQFEAIRIEILRQPRDLGKLREEVLAMRQRILEQHASGSDEFFDIKHDRGGLIDVEFIVQYLVLGHAHTHVPPVRQPRQYRPARDCRRTGPDSGRTGCTGT
jgi:glutamate-ammonia-ligase adenylyltransferase